MLFELFQNMYVVNKFQKPNFFPIQNKCVFSYDKWFITFILKITIAINISYDFFLN